MRNTPIFYENILIGYSGINISDSILMIGFITIFL